LLHTPLVQEGLSPDVISPQTNVCDVAAKETVAVDKNSSTINPNNNVPAYNFFIRVGFYGTRKKNPRTLSQYVLGGVHLIV